MLDKFIARLVCSSFVCAIILIPEPGSTTELKNTDDKCKQQAEVLAYKSACYLSADQEGCEMLSLFEIGGFAAGAGLAGSYASKVMMAKSNLNATTIQNFKNRMPEIRRLINLKDEIQAAMWKVDQKFDPGSIGGRRASYNGDYNISAENDYFKKIIDSSTNEDLKKLYVKKTSPEASAYAMEEKVRELFRKEAKNIFPNESAIEAELEKVSGKINKLIEQQDKELKDLKNSTDLERKKVVKPGGGYVVADMTKINSAYDKAELEIFKRYDIANKRAMEIQRVSQNNPGKALYIRLFSKFGRNGGEVPHLEEVEQMAATKTSGKGREALRSKAGLIGGTLIGTAAGIAEISRGQLDVRLCRKQLNLTDSDVEFLTNNRFAGLGSAKVYSDGGCDNFRIPEPDKFVAEAKEKFGENFPAGICKIIDSQNKKLDSMVGNATSNPTVSCETNRDTNFSVKDGDFEYRSGDKLYRAKFNSDSKFPDFRTLKVFNAESKKEDKRSTLIFQERFNILHRPGLANSRPDLVDIDFGTQKDQTVFPKGMIESAVRSRVTSTILSNECNSKLGVSSKDVSVGVRNGAR